MSLQVLAAVALKGVYGEDNLQLDLDLDLIQNAWDHGQSSTSIPLCNWTSTSQSGPKSLFQPIWSIDFIHPFRLF